MREMLAAAAIVGLLALVYVKACTGPDEPLARRVLSQSGFTDVQLLGGSLFGCGTGDNRATKFKAKGPTGLPVKGRVCSGFMKSATIRID